MKVKWNNNLIIIEIFFPPSSGRMDLNFTSKCTVPSLIEVDSELRHSNISSPSRTTP